MTAACACVTCTHRVSRAENHPFVIRWRARGRAQTAGMRLNSRACGMQFRRRGKSPSGLPRLLGRASQRRRAATRRRFVAHRVSSSTSLTTMTSVLPTRADFDSCRAREEEEDALTTLITQVCKSETNLREFLETRLAKLLNVQSRSSSTLL